MNSGQSSRGDILLVDDTPDNLHLLSAMLTERGYDVRAVTNGATALMGAQAQAPDLILLDIIMPGMDGYEVCQKLKANPLTRDTPVIFISAINEADDIVKAFSVGGIDYITKPFKEAEVFARIKTHLTLHRMQAQLEAQNTRLQKAEADLRRALEQEQRLNQRIEEMTALEERHRIARDIHDSLGHALVALNIQMETALTLWKEAPDKAYAFLVEAKQSGSSALQAVRKSVSDLRTDPLQGQLLEQAIANLTQEFHQTTGISLKRQIDLSMPFSNSVNTVVYRIVQEGLTNICKYANASAVHLQIQTTPVELQLMLQDDGDGFCVDESQAGFGLRGMRERVAALGGRLEIDSQPGAGCRITASFPRMNA
ncbi:MAG: response regulator [Leptolyngbyaceae cyanobacterium MO_188.B28]|nr:response regulator [Leptolyngbyaceae cyanobacterium MO_188.B28]